MALTKELDNGASIVILYVKKFNWLTEKESKMLGGEPYTGRIYRALKDPVTSAYYVSIDHKIESYPRVEGVRLTDLKYKTTEWECEMIELTDNNIIEYEILAEDYKKISDWIESDHIDFIAHLEKQQGLDVIASRKDDGVDADPNLEDRSAAYDPEMMERRIMDAMSNSLVPYQNNCHDSINYIGMRDPWMLQALEQVLLEVTKQIASEDSGPIIALSREIAISDELGKGANIYSTLFNIEQYINNNPEIGGKIDSVKKAIFHLILELIRLKTQS